MEENLRPRCLASVPQTEEYQRTIKKLTALSDAVQALLDEAPDPEELEMIERWEEVAGPISEQPAICDHLYGHDGPHEAAESELRDQLIVWARWYDGAPPEVLILEYCDSVLGPEDFDNGCCMLPKHHRGPHHNNGLTW